MNLDNHVLPTDTLLVVAMTSDNDENVIITEGHIPGPTRVADVISEVAKYSPKGGYAAVVAVESPEHQEYAREQFVSNEGLLELYKVLLELESRRDEYASDSALVGFFPYDEMYNKHYADAA